MAGAEVDLVQLGGPDGDFESQGQILLKIMLQHKAADILNLCEASGESMNVINSVSALHRIASVAGRRAWEDKRLSTLVTRIHSLFVCEDVRKAPRDIANTAWSFARLGITDPHLISAIAAAALKKINECCPAELSALAWSFAKLSYAPHGPLL